MGSCEVISNVTILLAVYRAYGLSSSIGTVVRKGQGKLMYKIIIFGLPGPVAKKLSVDQTQFSVTERQNQLAK